MDSDDFRPFDIEAERKRKQEQRKADIRRTVLAYKRVFTSADGELILGDLVAAFGFNLPVFLSTGSKPGEVKYDPLYGAIRSGQRDILLHIQAKLAAPDIPDGNPTGPVEVLTGLSQ